MKDVFKDALYMVIREQVAEELKGSIFSECNLLRQSLEMNSGSDWQVKESAERILKIIRGD